jgi:pimeloyl-ACP methyl ester carboxylesterase
MFLKKSNAISSEVANDGETPSRFSRPMRVRTLRVAGQELRVGIWPGAPTRTPLLLFNGIGAGFEALTPFANALTDIETIVFDVPGAGKSASPARPYRLWMLAMLASRVLDRLGYQQVDVLGVSWGGALAQQYALAESAQGISP